MLASTNVIFAICCGFVGATTFVFVFWNPSTILALNVTLIPQMLVDAYLSVPPELGFFSWQILLMYALSTILNVGLFSLPALAMMGLSRKFIVPKGVSLLLVGWMVFYVLMLFVLFEPEHFP